MIGYLVGVVLYFRPQVHQPVVDRHVILESVVVGIDKVHLTNQTGQIAVIGEMIRHRTVPPIETVSVRNGPGAVRIESGQQSHPRGDTHRIGTIGICEPHAP